MMEKFRICAGAVKVWSAKLLMGISWSDGLCVPPGYRDGAFPTQSWDATFTYAAEHGVAVEEVSAFRREPGVQRDAEVHSWAAEVRDAATWHSAGHQVRPGRDRRHLQR